MLMSSENDLENEIIQRKNKTSISEENLIAFFKKYGVTYTADSEELAINLALRGQQALNDNEIDLAEEIGNLLSELSKQWKDGFIKMKSHLLQAEIAGFKNEDKIPHLKRALNYAKKNNVQDVEIGVRIQLAFEQFKERKYKQVLKELKIIEKHPDLFEQNKRIIKELRARVFWDIDDFAKGFEATYAWYSILKNSTDDLHSLFMTVVYLLTVMSSTSLPHSQNEVEAIKSDITSLLTDLATSVHLFPQILPFIDILFAKSLKMVQPEILYNFTDLILQTARWNDEEKFLYFCQKIADAYYNIDDYDKAVELIEKAIKYTEEKKYYKVKQILQYKKTEFSSLIFYFMNFNSIFDPWIIQKIKIDSENTTEDLYLEPLSSGVNTFPATSYSHLLRILEKASEKSVVENSLELVGLNEEEERGFFVLDMQIAEDRIRVLMREDFSVETKELKTLHSTITPYYSVIGLISNKKKDEIEDIEEIEDTLLRLQRAINCPASKATIYLTKKKPYLNLFKFYLQQGGFRDLKIKLIDSAKSLGRYYDFSKSDDFLQIFQADPITIFDLTLRKAQELQPLTTLVNQAYNLKLTNTVLSNFLENLMDQFLKRSDTRFWREFYYQYAWLQTQGVFLSLSDEEKEEKKQIIDEILFFAEHLNNPNKILEGIYFQTYVSLVEENEDLIDKIIQLKEKAISYGNKKYELISDILKQLQETTDFSTSNKIEVILDDFCELCSFRDWPVSLELFIYLLNQLPQLTILFEACKKREVRDSGIYLYLHLSKYLIDIKRYDEALQLLLFIKELLSERVNKFTFSEHTWVYLNFLAEQYLYEIYPHLSKKEIKEFKLNKEKILKNILLKDKWISDPIYLAQIIKDYSILLLDKSEFSMGEKYYHWIEQLMFYAWDMFTDESNSVLLKEIQNLKKRIESQHFI